MGYFSNGTEGAGFEEAHCSRCVHGAWARDGWNPLDPAAEPGEIQCPVWSLHHLWNYDQFPEHAKTEAKKELAETIKTALSTLIPRGAGTVKDPQRCAMFVDVYTVRALPDPNQGDLFPPEKEG